MSNKIRIITAIIAVFFSGMSVSAAILASDAVHAVELVLLSIVLVVYGVFLLAWTFKRD